jgi:hypothetical protein
MSCPGTAKIGKQKYKYEVEIDPPSSCSVGDVVSPGLIIDGAHFNNQQSSYGRIASVQVIETIAGGESFTLGTFYLHLFNKPRTFNSSGAFSVESTSSDMTNLIEPVALAGSWISVGSKMQSMKVSPTESQYQTLNSAAIYGQLVAKAACSFAAGSRLLLRIFFEQD